MVNIRAESSMKFGKKMTENMSPTKLDMLKYYYYVRDCLMVSKSAFLNMPTINDVKQEVMEDIIYILVRAGFLLITPNGIESPIKQLIVA